MDEIADTYDQWTMRYKVNGDETLGADVGHVLDSRADCERHLKVWRETFPTLTYTDVRYLRRTVWTGPWIEP